MEVERQLAGAIATSTEGKLRPSGLFDVGDRITLSRYREVSIDDWLMKERMYSNVAAMPEPDRLALVDTLEQIVRGGFPDGRMRVRMRPRFG